MIVSLKKYNQINQLLILLIACTIVFRSICTPIIIFFLVFNLLHCKFIIIEKKHFKDILIISSPLLISILFFFNNDTISGGFKSVEKLLTLIIFPLFVLTNKNLNINFILNQYRIWFLVILLGFLVRFVLIFPEKITKYINGIDLIEIGYQYAISLGSHAPLLNLQVGFLSVVHFYFLIQSIVNKQFSKIFFNIILFFLSFSLVLIVNTRITLLAVILCVIVILIRELISLYSLKKTMIGLFLGLMITAAIIGGFVKLNPYMYEKYSSVTFIHMDKVGKLDEIKNPEIVVFNALVTRVSIWKASVEVAKENLPFGTGAEMGKKELFDYYKKTNQHFLAKYEFPVHNQFLDFSIKFGVIGFIVCCIYIFFPFYKSLDLLDFKSLFICFGTLFFISNLTDDFLIRFDGIVFSGLFYSLFSSISTFKK